VLITAAAPFIPPRLIEQLRPGGCMVIPEGAGDVQQMKRITKEEDGSLREEIFDRFSFVPMVKGKEG
jgi:protein-L-isoaspartate(D-aspartate) O-methyltransferase